ncbi:pyridoxal phosphate-dependent transferase, partial [Tribonema minus]
MERPTDAERTFEFLEPKCASKPSDEHVRSYQEANGDSIVKICHQHYESVALWSDAAATIRRELVGRLSPFMSPYGQMPLVYADWTATGRSLASIESYIANEVMPMYGNTHTTTSITGSQSTCFQHEARQLVAEYVNAKITGRASEDCVLFTGNGATAAVAKLVQALGLCQQLPPGTPRNQRPVVFVGPWEHHSNLLPWRESCAEVVMLRDTAWSRRGEGEGEGAGVDMEHLERVLVEYAGRPLAVGAFSAASNVTGVTCDTDAISGAHHVRFEYTFGVQRNVTGVTCDTDALSALLHRHGALACWDCATAAPHMRVNMNPVVVGADQSLVYKDAIFMSGHKFVGGPGTPGVLVVKRRLLANAVPTVPGGGSVFFVTPTDHRFLRNREEREEAGSPDLLGVVRLGLAMRLQQQLCALRIESCSAKTPPLPLPPPPAAAAAAAAATDAPQPPRRAATGGRLPILSFLIRCGSGGSGGAQQQQQRRGARPLFLHYNFVCALLNDLFGVQARGGCACAGPYAQRLLGLSASAVRALETQLLLKHELLRPGFTRLSLAFFNSEAEVDHILSAVHFVADKGALFLPQYRMNHRTGEWKHVTRANRFPERRWLGNFNFLAAASLRNGATSHPTMAAPAGGCTMNDAAERELLQGVQSAAMAKAQLLERAADINGSAQRPAIAGAVATAGLANHDSLLTAEGEALRWFAYPWERLGGGSGGDAAGVDTVEAVVDPSRYFYTSSQVQAELGWEDSVEWSMIEEGDRLCLGLSGGKDSLALLHVLLDLQRRAPLQRRVLTLKRRLLTVHGIPLPTGSSSISILLLYVAIVCSNAGDTLLTLVRFELACATVDPQTASFDPSPLKPYMAALGVNYHYLSDAIVERARAKLQGDSLCAFCSRAKRGLLYTCCRDNGYNKLVLAQHLDDLAESFMMSFLHNGQTRTMKANYLNDAGDVSIIRPLIYTRE